MNKKGFTVVELIVTFVFVMLITIGLMNLVNSYRNIEQKEETRRKMNSYKNEVLLAIQNDASRYIIDKIELLAPNKTDDYNLPDIYDKGLLITFKIPYQGDNKTKKLLIRNKGGEHSSEYDNTVASINYDGINYSAPDSFVLFESDTMLEEAASGGKITYTVVIKMLNEDINEYFNIKFAAISKE